MELVAIGLGLALVFVLWEWWGWQRLVRSTNEALQEASRRADSAEEQADYFREEWQTLSAQNTALAQQLATLRVDKFAVPEERDFVKKREPEPLPGEIVSFLDSIHNEEARQMVEDEVEAMRDGGLAPEEILRRIQRGDV